MDTIESPLASVIEKLIANGYHPLPVAPDSKAPSEWRGGKWRPMSGWQKYRTELPKDFMIKVWRSWPDANIGIVTGTRATPQYIVVAVDFDTDDYDILQELEAALPYSGVRKKGRRGHTSFYLAPVGTKGFRTPIVELLTDTRQTVIAPSIHPDTGKPYIWTTAQTLLNTPAADLPVLTEEDLSRFADTVESITKKPVKPAETVFTPVEPGEDKFWRLLNNTAYANLDMWVPDLRLPKCRREANGSYKAVASWRPSSTGRDMKDRNPNLSIAPNLGARDFGTGDRYTAINLVMHALSIDLDDAVKWLGTRVNMIHEAKFNVPPFSVETEAEPQSECPEVDAHGSDRTAEEPSGSSDASSEADPEPKQEGRPENTSEPPRDPTQNNHACREFPEHLLNPPGLVGEIVDWIVGGARRPSRMLALGPALTIVGTLMGTNVRGPTLSGSHLYLVGLAPSGAGKDYPLQAIGKLLKASNCGQLLGPSEFMSMSSVINFLQRQSLSLCPMDEFGAFLRKLNSRNSSTHEQSISKIFRSLWGISFGDYMSPEWAGRAAVEVKCPAMSIYGVSTAEEYFESLQSADIRNGFLNRFLVFSTDIKPVEQDPAHDGTPPDALRLRIATKFNEAMNLNPAQRDLPLNAPRIPKDMYWNGGRPIYQEMVKRVERVSEDKYLEPYFARTCENAVRLASIIAWGCDRMEVIKEDMEWARDVTLWSAQNMAASAQQFMSASPWEADVMKILNTIAASPKGISRSALLLKCRHKKKIFGEFLDHLIETGEITWITKKSPKGGPPKTIYFIRRQPEAN